MVRTILLKKIGAVIMALLVAAAMMPAAMETAHAETGPVHVAYGDYEFDLWITDEGEQSSLILTKYTGNDSVLILPSPVIYNGIQYDSYLSVGAGVFSENETIEKIIIPGGYDGIYKNAFSGCSKLEEVVIADSVEYIGKGAFSGCPGLKTYKIGGGSIGGIESAGAGQDSTGTVYEGVTFHIKEAGSVDNYFKSLNSDPNQEDITIIYEEDPAAEANAATNEINIDEEVVPEWSCRWSTIAAGGTTTAGWDNVENAAYYIAKAYCIPEEGTEAESSPVRIDNKDMGSDSYDFEKDYAKEEGIGEGFFTSNGSGKYWLKITAYDENDESFLEVVTSPIQFWKTSVTVNTEDADGNPVPEEGGSVMVGVDGSHETVENYEGTTYFLPAVTSDGEQANAEIEVSGVNRGFYYEGIGTSDSDNIADKTASFPITGEKNITITFRQCSTRIPASVELGQNGASYAEAFCEAVNTKDAGADAVSKGTMIKYKEFESSTEGDVIEWLEDVASDVDGLTDENGLYWAGCVGLKTMSEYVSSGGEDAFEKDRQSTVLIAENQTFYFLWEVPVNSVALTIEKPVCGSKVSHDPEKQAFVNGPKITVAATSHAAVVISMWTNSTGEMFTGTIKGGTIYGVKAGIAPDFGYCFAVDDQGTINVSVNGKTEKKSADSFEGMQTIASLTAVHDWDAGKVTKEPTTKAKGVKTFTCKGCGKKKTEAIPELTVEEALDGGASAEAADTAIKNLPNDKDPKGTVLSKLKLRSLKQTKNSVKIQWQKVSGAKKYVIYGNKCGTKNKMKKLTTVKGSSKLFKKVAGKKVKKGTYYKFMIVALNKNNKVVTTSRFIHAATKGGKVTNHKSVTVKKAVITKAKKLKVGRTLKLGAKTVKAVKKLKVSIHVPTRYESANKKIATVTAKGVIRAKKKGTCYVYAFAQNGVFKKIKVVVK